VKALVRGKRVAVVGRAGSIIGTGNGPAIDRADVVIRINWLLPILDGQVADVGSRTDLVYTCVTCATARRLAEEGGIQWEATTGRRRKRATKKWFARTKMDRIRATTGLTCVAEVLRYEPKEVRLYGFDLFRSEYFQERTPDGNSTTGKKDGSWVHEAKFEARAWRKMLVRHPEVKPDAIFRRALK